MSNAVYLNGEYLSRDKASISVFDRGFMFGDGLYDVIPCYDGKVLGFDAHLRRLFTSLEALDLDPGYSVEQWAAIGANLLKHAESRFVSLYIQVSRGVQYERRHVPDEHSTPTVMATTFSFTPPTVDSLLHGYHVMSVSDPRSQYSHYKTLSHLPNIQLARAAKANNCQEVILHREGMAIEGMSSNLFVVKNGVIKTPPASPALVSGVTRDIIIHMANINNTELQFQAIPMDTLHNADEIWLTGSTKEIVPVTQLDGQKIGNGLGGPLWRFMLEAYRYYREEHLLSLEPEYEISATN